MQFIQWLIERFREEKNNMFILRIPLHAFAWQRNRLGSFPAARTFCYFSCPDQAERSPFVFVPFHHRKCKSILDICFRDELLGNVAAWDRFPLPEHFVTCLSLDQAERSPFIVVPFRHSKCKSTLCILFRDEFLILWSRVGSSAALRSSAKL